MIEKINLSRFFALSFLVTGACATAAGTDLPLEEKKQSVIQFMGEHQIRLGTSKDPKLCEAFLEDFKRQTNIEYVKTLVVAHDYFDPALQKYLKQCPKMELRTPVSGRSGGYVGTPSLKLYKVDIDNNPANGEEYLYLETAFWQQSTRATNYKAHIGSGTSYRLVDFAGCGIAGRIHVGAARTYTLDTDLSRERPDTSYHDVIKYQGKYYVYDLLFLSGYGRPLKLFAYDPERSIKFSSICTFTP